MRRHVPGRENRAARRETPKREESDDLREERSRGLGARRGRCVRLAAASSLLAILLLAPREKSARRFPPVVFLEGSDERERASVDDADRAFEGSAGDGGPGSGERAFGARAYSGKTDDDNLSHFFDDDDPARGPGCREISFDRLHRPTCNLLHEFPVLTYSIASRGSYRHAWLGGEAALKTSLMQDPYLSEHDAWEIFEKTRLDALVMERLTSSPRVALVHAHCGTSLVTEAFHGEVQKYVVPGSGYVRKLGDEAGVRPRNAFAVGEKLEMALSMAESLADLHGFEEGVMVHGDVQLCQWLKTKEGVMKLNDFNGAFLMRWDEEREEYCDYVKKYAHGNYRAPEEFAHTGLNEKLDVFSLGNNMYALLTGLWNFYEADDDFDNQQKRIFRGDLPFIDERYRTRSFGEGELVNVIEKCWIHDPNQRASIFDVVRMLRSAVEKNGDQE